MNTDVHEKMVPSGELASHCLFAGDPNNPPIILLHGAGLVQAQPLTGCFVPRI